LSEQNEHAKVIKFSVSQAKTYEMCNRKWFLEKVDKLPIKMADSTTRGSILHEVLERWLLANEQGLDEKGNPVNLYPENWYIKEEKGQTKEITFAEQAWIRRIIPDAIANGVLWRPPNRRVEFKFEEELLPSENGLPAVQITGLIDLAYDWTIGDHKSCKNLNWVLNSIEGSDKYIGDDVQLLTYCYYWAKYRTNGFEKDPPEYMDVEHYQYPFEGKDKRKGQGIPQTTKARVSWKRVLQNFETLKKTAEKCRDTRYKSTKYIEIEPNEESCGAYGGCNFVAICAGQESLDNYKERIKYQITPIGQYTEIPKEQIDMSDPFDDLLEETTKNDEANTANLETPVTDTKKEETPDPAKNETKFKVDGTREELIEKIGTLQDMQDNMGMDMTEQIKQLQAQVDKLDAEEKAKQEAEAKAKADAEQAKKEAEELAKKEAEEKKAEQGKGDVDTKTNAEPDSSGSVESTPENEASDSVIIDAGAYEAYEPNFKTKAKRSPSGIILCINGHAQGYSKYITAQKIWDEYSKSALAYCKSTGKEEPTIFALRDAVAGKAEEIAEKLKGHVILANSITANTRPLCAALSELDNAQVFIGNAS
jgi:hypothetical protein